MGNPLIANLKKHSFRIRLNIVLHFAGKKICVFGVHLIRPKIIVHFFTNLVMILVIMNVQIAWLMKGDVNKVSILSPKLHSLDTSLHTRWKLGSP